jgi:hypothetical protein
VTCHCEDDADNLSTLLEGKLKEKYLNVKRNPISGEKNEHPYRAVHLTFTKPITEKGETSQIYCEIQVRTVMADAWAVQNHKYLYRNNVEGEAQELTNAVSEIMNACEKLWSLVKKKSLEEEVEGYSKDTSDTPRKVETGLQTTQRSIEKVKELEEWFESNKVTASKGMQKLGIKTFMEVEVELPTLDLDFDGRILKENARKSTISTFGWSIGVFLDNRLGCTPTKDSSGIHAEIAIKDDEEVLYDYWAIHHNGAFYLKKSLFEDRRKPNQIFFNTRIIRITEVFMYINNLYSFFSVPSNEKIEVTIRHGGLKGRVLSSSSPSRSLLEKYKTEHDEVHTKIETTLDEINSNIVNVVEEFTKPLFVQFESFELPREVLEDIVVNFRNGKIV